MKKSIKYICDGIGYGLSFLLTKQLSRLYAFIINNIYSGWIKASLRSCGENFQISYPVDHVGLKYVSIGANFTSFSRLRLEAYDSHNNHEYNPSIIIGENVSINYDCHLGCINKIDIGNNVLIASKVFITDHFHGNTSAESLLLPPSQRLVESKGPVIIEDNVWIGEGVAIMPNVVIGKNSIIGANAVVTKSFPPNSVIAGNPAVLIKTLI